MHSDGNQGTGCQNLCCLIVPFRNEQRTVPRAKLVVDRNKKMKTEKGFLVRNCIKVELCIAHPGTNAEWEFAVRRWMFRLSDGFLW